MLRYSDSTLDALRLVGDPVPDAIVAELARAGSIDEVNGMLRSLVRNGQPVPEELPDGIEYWLRDTGLPAWADTERIERATRLSVEHGIQISLILATASLVTCYAGQKGVKALAFTYRLNQDPYRRIAETGQFVMDVTHPGGLRPGGRGIPVIQKVRLMHSAIRHLIRETGRWPEDELGAPLCQEDMLGTLCTFSWVVVDCLDRLGIELTRDEADDYLYLWRVVGEMLGCEADMIPTSMAEAADLVTAVRRRQLGPSPEGVAMTKALFEMHAGIIPGEVFDGVMPAVTRQLVGDQIADWMEVPRSRWDNVLEHGETIGDFFDDVDRSMGRLGNLVDRLGVALLTRGAIQLAGYRRAPFDIPDSLLTSWVERGKLPAAA